MTTYLKNAGQFLLDTGLLGEINRLVLHPRGLALVVEERLPGEMALADVLLDGRSDPEGINFGQDMLRSIQERLDTLPPITRYRRELFPPEGIELLDKEDVPRG